MAANDKQVDGDHYKGKIQHWDYVYANELDYFQAQITKYVGRCRKKNGLIDLRKAQHVLEKYIELVEAEEEEEASEPTAHYVNPDCDVSSYQLPLIKPRQGS